MSGLCTRAMFKQATVALVLVLGGPAMVSAERPGEAAGRLTTVCAARGHPDEACQCLSREAGSRFGLDQLEHIAEALEAGDRLAEAGDRMRRAGMPESEVASVIDRLHTAEVVIQQTCGASIFEPAADD
ncbi:hypothetical protein [Maricaulis sp.]|uniref:hypothetical protein n=1 Tax=Maricaulis sp. TaxID=1486257 RepID=UPI003A91EB07